MYTRRKKEINHVSAAYFADSLMHCDFRERLRVFMLFLETLLRLFSADITVVAQISSVVAALLWIPY